MEQELEQSLACIRKENEREWARIGTSSITAD